MGKTTILALRIVLAMALAGSLLVQAVGAALFGSDFEDDPNLSYLRVPLVVVLVLGIATIQITMVCIWRLLTMVRRGTVFSEAAFRYVDIVIGAIAAASVLTFAFAVLAASANHRVPDDEVAPGIVFLICGASVMIAGVALLVVVMRSLLSQAIDRDAEAHHLRAELDEVI
ncbi:DUF2975 domain-containing protein [Glycomyces tenuis]|uniref:DUF2975 domain-containing protein n=1 Tax=Glycomyces tenuis TaxID=58116 RepID=UPI00047E24C9|nr:DUF2975 domain-containing protein [Glycomyces tenuis]